MSHLRLLHSFPASPPGQETSVTARPGLVSPRSVYSYVFRPFRSEPTRSIPSNLKPRISSILGRSFFPRRQGPSEQVIEMLNEWRKSLAMRTVCRGVLGQTD